LIGFVEWKNVEEHITFTRTEAFKEAVLNVLTPIVTGEDQAELFHVPFVTSPLPSLEAPATEVARITPKEGVRFEEVTNAVEKAVTALNNDTLIGKNSTLRGVAWGRAIEKESTVILVTGWDSFKVCILFFI
jgi:hypothetical protein